MAHNAPRARAWIVRACAKPMKRLPNPPSHTPCARRQAKNAVIGGVQLGASDLGVSIDEGLLINASHSLQVADIECILRAAIARMLALELAMGLLFRLGFLQRGELGLGQHQALLGALGF